MSLNSNAEKNLMINADRLWASDLRIAAEMGRNARTARHGVLPVRAGCAYVGKLGADCILYFRLPDGIEPVLNLHRLYR